MFFNKRKAWKQEVNRRTLLCYKYVRVVKDGPEELRLCIAVDSSKFYLFPFEDAVNDPRKSLKYRGRYLTGEMEGLRLREVSPGHCVLVARESATGAEQLASKRA